MNSADQNLRLFEGYLTSNLGGTVGVNIDGLAAHFLSYDVYVYLDMENSDSQAVNSVRSISDGNTVYYLDDADGNTFTGSFIEVSSTNPDVPTVGNYVVFRGLSSDSVRIRIDGINPTGS